MQANQKYIQIVGDVAIPLLGFFLWNWSLYFIILFYLLDYFGSEIICNMKSKKIIQFQKRGQFEWLKMAIFSLFLFIAGVFLMHLAMKTILPEIDFRKEIINFWTYKDMGIEQGYFLVPLVFMVNYLRYKVEFVMQAKHKTTSLKQIWKNHFTVHFAILSGAALFVGLSTFVVFKEIVYVLGLVLASGTFQLRKQSY